MAFKIFHVKNVCIMTSVCIFKKWCTHASFEKTAYLYHFRFMLYHVRERKNKENAYFVWIVYLLIKLCNMFDEAFLLTSVYVMLCVYNSIGYYLKINVLFYHNT